MHIQEIMMYDTVAPFVMGNEIRDVAFSTYNPATDCFEDHNLSEFLLEKKWIVLYFYPADFTFVCPTELSDVAAFHDELTRMGVELIAVSTDTKYSHLAWCKTEQLLGSVNFLLASDPTGGLSSLFGVYDAKAGTALRGTFIISPEGVLVGAEVNYYNVGRNAAELTRKMRAYTYLHTHPHQACPAAWDEGAPVLTPSEQLVGRVYEYLHS